MKARRHGGTETRKVPVKPSQKSWQGAGGAKRTMSRHAPRIDDRGAVLGWRRPKPTLLKAGKTPTRACDPVRMVGMSKINIFAVCDKYSSIIVMSWLTVEIRRVAEFGGREIRSKEVRLATLQGRVYIMHN
jgi:hypothetical protein